MANTAPRFSKIPQFTEQTDTANPFNGKDVGSYSTPTLADIDADGDLDAFSGEWDGTLNYFKNTGNKNNPKFTEVIGTANPFNGKNVGYYSTPTLADIDGDGDLDALIGEYDGIFNYFKNTGNKTNPQFTEVTGTANPFNGKDVGYYSTPTLGDIDGDGDLDAFSGAEDGIINYFKNTGNQTNPKFTQVIGTANPLNWEVGDNSTPTLAEIDADGDLDAFIGEYYGYFYYFKNTGNKNNPQFTYQTGTANPLNELYVSLYSTPTLADIDADGDLDAFSGELNGTIYYFKDISQPPIYNLTLINEDETAPTGNTIAEIISDNTVGDPEGAVEAVAIAAVDNKNGTWQYSTDGGSTWNNFGSVTQAAARLLDSTNKVRFIPKANWYGTANITLRLWDKTTGVAGGTANTTSNGGETAFSVETTIATVYVRSVIDNTAPKFSKIPQFTHLYGSPNPLNGFDVADSVFGDSTPTFADIDADGDLDAFSGEDNGFFNYFKNTGNKTNPQFTEVIGTANPLNGFDVGDYFFGSSTPTFADIDADGDLDAFSGEDNGIFNYFKNTGNETNPQFTEVIGTANPLNGQDVGSYSTPTLADIDADGDLDVFSGEYSGTIKYFKNTGNKTNPQFTEVMGTANPLNWDVGSNSAPTLADLDGDGDLDAFSGEGSGIFYYFKNTGNQTNPKFTYQAGIANPLNGQDVSLASTPTLADIDADGDLDVFSGEFLGSFYYYKNTSEPPIYNLTAVNEDETAPTGNTVAEIITDNTVIDPEGAVEAIAVTAADNTNGAWQYSTNGGNTWNNFGSVTEATARLLNSTNKMRFIPNPDWFGTANITFRLWDKTKGVVGGIANTTSNGGETAFSVETTTAAITVNDVSENQPPTAINLDSNKVGENQPSGTVVGNITTTDPDAGQTHSYQLVAGTGSTDNTAFEIVGNQLKTKNVFDFETKSSYSIRVQTNDGNGGTFQQVFTINVNDIGEFVLLKDIRSGSGSSTPSNLTNVNGTLFFTANNGTNGIELFSSNGTAEGTVLLKDIFVNGGSSNPSNLTNVNNILFFTADNGTNGVELWKSNGAATGTVLLKDIVLNDGSSDPSNLTNVNNILFFTADNGTKGVELWKSNGTATGTVLVKDILLNDGSSDPSNLTNVNGTLYFTADNGTNGVELWKSNGTAAGTVLVKDILLNGGSSDPSNLTNVNGTLYFTANDGINGVELWKSDGTAAGTVLVKDILLNGGSSNPYNLTNVNGTLYFTANNSINGKELWTSDGTSGGTVLVQDILVGGRGSQPANLTDMLGELYFTANNGTNGIELWTTPI
ncbi:MAG: VCBS repeat-containing protein [Gomphosphaeria aponina SAG 52.96 = DSM 107014]|uniref:VCBS repeat-containing protein n=1 Tax=Gomphosphaeria aponina SAG 52.96 = DSM 107014 TaxID=1521640 RepID=A0A941GN01_9CHRO|nr:VCBS repeat-containing protein [Gomphosphaeria aponina SAG 52.96 = DSM 107014]